MTRAWLVPRRKVTIVLCSLTLASMWCAGSTRSDDAKSVGQRVFYTGHSFHMFVPPRVEQLVKSAGIEGHRLVGTQGIGGSRVIQHWELADDKNKAKRALESGQVDVFTMAAHVIMPDPGIDHFTEFGLRHNPNLRLLVQASWMAFDQTSPQKRVRDNAERDATNVEELDAATKAWIAKLESQVDGLNQQHGRRAVFIVPAGLAVNSLRRQIVAGTFPEITKQSQLFRDPIGHGLAHIQALTAYCNFAAIYRRSPEGLNLDEPTITKEQHAILQRIAWETVSNYSHSGVATKDK